MLVLLQFVSHARVGGCTPLFLFPLLLQSSALNFFSHTFLGTLLVGRGIFLAPFSGFFALRPALACLPRKDPSCASPLVELAS